MPDVLYSTRACRCWAIGGRDDAGQSADHLVGVYDPALGTWLHLDVQHHQDEQGQGIDQVLQPRSSHQVRGGGGEDASAYLL